MVFYRKYRPQTIDELDSELVRQKLLSFLSSKDIAHAFLFTGHKGLGKTSAARIVAKAVNCLSRQTINKEPRTKNKEHKEKIVQSSIRQSRIKVQSSEGIEPCNNCHQCVSITNGTNIDVLEIDGASNRGIDEIRDLREKVRLSPAYARKKVYIIDEVHMLTTEAFNALLKTLEEPPLHVIFVLCTTEPQKLPETIVSRCLRVPFKTAEAEDLVRSFRRIVDSENLNIEDDVLYLIASLSDGSFRDGAKLLEEMVLISGGSKITKELVEKKYQVSSIKYQVSQMLRFLSQKNTKEALGLISNIVDQGVDIRYFIEQLINALHGLLLYRTGVESKDEFSIFNSAKPNQFSIENIKELVELLSRAYGELRYAVLPQLPLELTVVEWCVQKTENQAKLGQNTATVGKSVVGSTVLRSADLLEHQGVPKDNFWQELISKVKAYNHSIAGVLRGCKIKEYDNKRLVIETGYKFHKERLQEKETHDILEKTCREIVGKPIDVSIILKIKN